MRSTAFFSLLSVATIANALPMDSLDSPAIVDRADDGSYRWQESGAAVQASTPSWQAAPASSAVATAWQEKPTSAAGGWAAKATSAAVEQAWEGAPAQATSAAGAAATGSAATVEASSKGEEESPASGGGSSSGSAGSGAYKEYHGDGSNWPKKSAWVGSFDAM